VRLSPTRWFTLVLGYVSLLPFVGCGDVAIHIAPPSEGDDPGECSDAADNDEDGLYDCDDPDCAGAPECELNEPPTVPEVRVEPIEARTADTLHCVIQTASVDPEGVPVSYSFSWTLDGEDAVIADSVVEAENTSKGQVWSCTVLATDGLVTAPAASDSITVGNTPPTAPSTTVVPSPPNLRDDLRCSLDTPSFDADGDVVAYSYEWVVDGQPTGYTQEVVPWWATSIYDLWVCKVVPSDGTDDGPSGESSATVQIDAAYHVSVGLWHTCSVHFDGLGYSCWGADDEGEYDFGQVTQVPPVSAAAVTSGALHSCVMAFDSTAVTCWGDNSQDQTISPAGTFMQIDAGAWHTCGVVFDGQIACWGSSMLWSEVPPTERALEVASGDEFSCARMEDGGVECWNFPYDPPPGLPANSEWWQITAGGDHACALAEDGNHVCWGDDSAGQISEAPPGVLFSQISAGAAHTCGVAQGNGFLHCWGANAYGQQAPLPTGVFSHVAAGVNHSCGVRPNLTVDCWGCDGTAVGQCAGLD
jgi:hypothetical protein